MSVFLITGANRGIGAELDRQLTQRGDTVLGTARNHPEYLQLDVAAPSSHRDLALELEGKQIDCLVCNAGVFLDKNENLADGFPAQMWAESFAVNVTGVFLSVQALLPNLQMSAHPKIAIVSSQMGSDTRAPGGKYIYRASKAAALNLGLNLASDLKALGVAVGVYHPGWVKTDMGGPDGEITVEQAADGLISRFDELALRNTGCFQTWDGRDHPY